MRIPKGCGNPNKFIYSSDNNKHCPKLLLTLASQKKRKTMKIKEGFVLREMCGENIVAAEGLQNINFNKLISLNSTAAFLWKELVGKEFSVEDMASLLVEEYGIDMELAVKDSKALCQAWSDAGVAE